MQVFLPYPDYASSVACLDPSRLGNQVYRECLTLVNGGWEKHPAAKIWAGHKYHLCLYALAGLSELARRGRPYPAIRYRFTLLLLHYQPIDAHNGAPPIVGHPPFHAAHRSQLLAKDPTWYGQFGWTEPAGDLPYIWRLS